jgi:hypothetical protein
MSISRILDLLSQLLSILRDHSVAEWEVEIADRVEGLRSAAQAGDSHLLIKELQEVMRMFGGMGSFNDVFVTERAGHRIGPGQVGTVNSRLQKLSTELFVLVEQEIERISGGSR